MTRPTKPAGTVVRLVDFNDNNKSITPVEMLRDLVADFEAGRDSATQMIVAWLDENRRMVRARANLSCWEEVAMYAFAQEATMRKAHEE